MTPKERVRELPLLSRIISVVALAAALSVAGCRDQPAQPRPLSEAEIQAQAVFGATFAGGKDDWFALERSGGKLRVAQLRHPTTTFRRQDVTATEQVNGLTEWADLTVSCRQIRWNDGAWSEWQPGSGDPGLIGALAGGRSVDWDMHFEKKNGHWTYRHTAGYDFVRDRPLLAKMIKEAFKPAERRPAPVKP